MRWVGHVACMGERRGIYRVLVGKPEGKETTWKNWRIFRKWVEGAWVGLICLKIGIGGRHL